MFTQGPKRRPGAAPSRDRVDLKIMVSKSMLTPDAMALCMFARTVEVRHLVAWLQKTRIRYERRVLDSICAGLNYTKCY